MSHPQYEQRLAVYRDLEPEEQEEVDRHLRECPACAARLADYRAMQRELSASRVPGPDGRLREEFHTAVAGAGQEARRASRSRPLWRATLAAGNAAAWAGVAAIAVVLVVGLAVAGRPLAEKAWPGAQPAETPASGLGGIIVRDEFIASYPTTTHEGWQPDQVPQLSPDGRRVAYFVPDAEPDGINLLVVGNLATGREEWRGFVNGCLHTSARWSPDSRSLAFVLSRPQLGGTVASELWRVDLERRPSWLQALRAGVMRVFGRAETNPPGLRLLYSGDAQLTSSMGPAILVERWSVDGRYIELAASAGIGEGYGRRVRADGRGTEVIGEPGAAEFGVDQPWLRSHPARAPTGDYWLGVVGTDGLPSKPAGTPAGGESLVRYDVKPRGAHALAFFAGEIRPLDLRISPDGEWIALVTAGNGDAPTESWTVRRDGTGLRQAPGLADGEFAWGAPGRIYFRVPPRKAGTGILYELDLASGRVGLVADAWREQGIVAVSRDGGRLLVSRSRGDVSELRWVELAPRPADEPTPAPEPTTAAQEPTLDPTAVAVQMQVRLEVIPTSGPGGRTGWRIAGWADGLRSHGYSAGPYRWLDDDHLLLFPVTAREPIEWQSELEISQPAVLGLADGQAWAAPSLEDRGLWDVVQWSAGLGRLVAVNGDELQLLDLQGKVTERISGAGSPPLSLSPSGLRAMTASAWFDLQSGQRVGFRALDTHDIFVRHWTSDETRVFMCCYAYADARNGVGYEASTVDGLFAPGAGANPGFRYNSGRWLAGDRYFLPSRFIAPADPSEDWPGVLIFDPAEKRWLDVLAAAGLPAWPASGAPGQYPPATLPSPDGRLVAVGHGPNYPAGRQPVYLIGLAAFESRTIAGSQGFSPISWSGDGRYLLLLEPGRGYRLASVETAALEPGLVCPPSERSPLWQPHGARLAYVDTAKQQVGIWDAAGRQVGGAELPVPAAELIWSEQGGRLALLGEDGSLWWLADPARGVVERLTPPLPGAGSVQWSPDGGRIAVATAAEVYVVEPGG